MRPEPRWPRTPQTSAAPSAPPGASPVAAPQGRGQDVHLRALNARPKAGHSRAQGRAQGHAAPTQLALCTRWVQAAPVFEASLALEFLGFADPEAREGVAALREKRPPRFDAL